jgi:cytochrome oxidase Cu insertion factor (SCO1/SenC/PrrC family)
MVRRVDISSRRIAVLAVLVLGSLMPARVAVAQGCIISRSGLESDGAAGGSYLMPGDWTATAGFRHVYSHVHFSGPTENFSRAQLGTEVQSKTNLDDLVVNYQLTNRISLTGTLPFLYASRRLQSQYATLHTSGLSDISVGAQTWIRSPKSERAATNNAQIGFSLLIPSGSDHQNNVVATTYGATPTTQYPDYSVQPGGGAWGGIMSWQAFQNLGNDTIAFFGGNYVMTQGGYHDFWTSHGGTSSGPPAATPGLTQFDAIQDQYLLEVGASHPAPKIKGLALSLTMRDEGVPAHNLIGSNLGFKRPGFGIALTPGFAYTRGNSSLQFSLGKVLIRDRTKSVAEEVNGVHEGDAAFANYVWMAGYTLRMPGRKSAAGDLGQASAHASGVARAMTDGVVPNHTPQAATDGFKSFSLKTVDGQKKTLRDFSNKVTMVTFFFPRCPYCNVELPEIQKIYDRYKEKGLSAVWINVLPEETKLIPGWQVAKNFTVPVLIGESQEVLQRDYRIESTPATYLLDGEGRVLFHADGYKSGDEKVLEAKIETVLNAGVAMPATASLPACPPSFRLPRPTPFALGNGLMQ